MGAPDPLDVVVFCILLQATVALSIAIGVVVAREVRSSFGG